jgi:hypothetical protein
MSRLKRLLTEAGFLNPSRGVGAFRRSVYLALGVVCILVGGGLIAFEKATVGGFILVLAAINVSLAHVRC